MGKNTSICTSYEGCLSDAWNVGNGVRQGDATAGIPFNVYVNEDLTDLANQPLGCEPSGSTVNIFCYADDIASPAHTKYSLQIMFDKLASK